MSYVWKLWIGFTLVLCVLLTAMVFISLTALRLEQAEIAARKQAAVDEKVRLALWRMDSALAPLLAQENARSASFEHLAPSFASRGDKEARQVALLRRPRSAVGEPSQVLLRFQFPLDEGIPATLSPARLHSNPLATKADLTPELQRLATRVPWRSLPGHLPEPANASFEANDSFSGPAPDVDPLVTEDAAQARDSAEFRQRSQSLMLNNAFVQQRRQEPRAYRDRIDNLMTPFWIAGEMLLARRLQGGEQEYVQGTLLDWPALQVWLRSLVVDLLPEARLQPLAEFDAAGEAGMLAALPVRLLPGPVPGGHPQRSTVTLTLGLAWLAVLLASLVAALLVHGVVRFSQRRGDFVSAVTHELRTPLTTFRVYTEMLVHGMVCDADARQEYLQTLHDQSLRLSHLVENVLAYSRLERGRGLEPPEALAMKQLLDPILPTLRDQAAAGGMELTVDCDRAFAGTVLANRAAVEQILVNLVDNACKYAQEASDRRICLSAKKQGRYQVLKVRDFGPGMPPRRTRFQVFGKSVQEAAHSAPGVGLGLGLSRRLAEQMGGRLDIDRTVTEGASFVLQLRLAPRAER